VHRRRLFLPAFAIAAVLPAAVLAQGTSKTLQVPAGYMPPPGMCRVWVDGVPASKQPAITDCQKALRNMPTNAQVVFGSPKAPTPARDTTRAKRDTVVKKPAVRPPPG